MDENTPANTTIGEPITATDPDEGDILTYSLTGADASKFSIDPSSGQLRTELGLDYESSATHSVTVVAKDDAITPLSDEVGVTITVNNLDEPGTITISPSTPGVNVTLTAELEDPDGTTTGVTWQWAQRASTGDSSWANITEATGNTHTPSSAGVYLRVIAQYTDPQGGGKTTVKEIPLSITNNPPTFDASAPTTASVAENNQDQATVGSPITGSDPNGDPLTYGLRDTNANSGHAASFSISGIGQITVALGVRLDHEAQETYLVTVDLSDGRNPNGGTDNTADASRPITITVTDANDPGTVTISNSYPQNGLAITASLADQDGLIASSETWQWAQSDNTEGPWNNISGATQFSYTPLPADLDKYLQATVTYTDSTYGGNQTASTVTDNPVDEQIALDQDSYAFYTFENSIADAPVIGDLPKASNTNGTVVYSLNGGDARRYNINNGGITVRENAQLDYEADPPDLSHSMTIEVTDDSGARDTAQVTINIKDLMEDNETKSMAINGHGTITWTRIAETQFLMARNQDGVRKPELELNAQLDPCFKEGQPGLSRLHNRPDWKIYDQYQLDMWWDGNTLKYRDPRRSQEWTGYSITQPDSSLRPGHQRKLPHGIP